MADREQFEAITKTSKKGQFGARKFHLTYKTHINFEELCLFLQEKAGPLIWHSMVHEMGSSAVGYPHTHVAWMGRKLNVRQNYFDFQPTSETQPIHPNIATLATDLHATRVWEYHKKDPVNIQQSETGPAEQASNSDLWDQAKNCATLKEAADLYDIRPRTLADLKLLRAPSQASTAIPPLDRSFSWTLNLPLDFRCLFLWGTSGTGKTRRGIACFESPLVISHLEDLKRYRPDRHDGLLFDDLSFANLEPGTLIHLTDWELPRTINVKHGSVTIPAHTRKVFTFNLHWRDCFPPMQVAQEQAISRRMHSIHVVGPTYNIHEAEQEMEVADLQADLPPSIPCTLEDHPDLPWPLAQPEQMWETEETAQPLVVLPHTSGV